MLSSIVCFQFSDHWLWLTYYSIYLFVQMSVLFLDGCVSVPLAIRDSWPCSSCEDNCSEENIAQIEGKISKQYDFMLNKKIRGKSVATWNYVWVSVFIYLSTYLSIVWLIFYYILCNYLHCILYNKITCILTHNT